MPVAGALDAGRVVGRPSTPQLRLWLSLRPVAVVLAVGLVVLVVVADQVGEGEAVVAGDEVDAGVGAAAARGVDVAGARQSREASSGTWPGVAAPEPPHAVAVRAVPLRPARRETAQLVAVGAGVPGLGDQLDRREHGVLLDDLEEGAAAGRPRSPRTSTGARSKRKPSTCMSVTQ